MLKIFFGNPSGATAYTLSAESGTFTLTGSNATLKMSRRVTADTGSFALSGTAATLQMSRKLAAASGAYTFTGQDVTLTYVQATSSDDWRRRCIRRGRR